MSFQYFYVSIRSASPFSFDIKKCFFEGIVFMIFQNIIFSLSLICFIGVAMVEDEYGLCEEYLCRVSKKLRINCFLII